MKQFQLIQAIKSGDPDDVNKLLRTDAAKQYLGPAEDSLQRAIFVIPGNFHGLTYFIALTIVILIFIWKDDVFLILRILISSKFDLHTKHAKPRNFFIQQCL